MRKIVTLSMRDQIYEALRESIMKNAYLPGAMLPIDKLAEDFGVSATPVREALVRLEAESLVTLIPNKGAMVTEIKTQDIRNNWEMRLLLEPYAAAKSCHLIPEGDLLKLRKEILDMKSAPFDNDRYVGLDTKLHDTLYIHLSNAVLRDSIRRVHQMSIRIRYFPEGSVQMHTQVVDEVLDEHLTIVDALLSRDVDRVEKSVKTHLENGEARTIEAFIKNK
jgi:DNA-binding GntR family transcriptional regulator